MTCVHSGCIGSSGTSKSIRAPCRLPWVSSTRCRVKCRRDSDIPVVHTRRHPNSAPRLDRAPLVVAARRWIGDEERGDRCITMCGVAVHPAPDCNVWRLRTAARTGGRGLCQWHCRTPLRSLLLHTHCAGVDDQTQQQKDEHRHAHRYTNDNGRRDLAVCAPVTRPAYEARRRDRGALRLRGGG